MSICPSCQAEIVEGDQFCSRCGEELIDPVGQQIQSGRRLIILCALIIIFLHFFVGGINLFLTIGGRTVATQECLNIAVSISLEAALLYMTYQGHAWARWLTALLSLAGVALLLFFLPQFAASEAAVFMLVVVALGMGACGLILLLSPSVRIFQRAQRNRVKPAT